MLSTTQSTFSFDALRSNFGIAPNFVIHYCVLVEFSLQDPAVYLNAENIHQPELFWDETSSLTAGLFKLALVKFNTQLIFGDAAIKHIRWKTIILSFLAM